jgi:hypothetical protein
VQDGTLVAADFHDSLLFAEGGRPAPNARVFSTDAIGTWTCIGALESDGSVKGAGSLAQVTLKIKEGGGTYSNGSDKSPVTWEQDASTPQLAHGDIGDDAADHIDMDLNDQGRLVLRQNASGRVLLFSKSG